MRLPSTRRFQAREVLLALGSTVLNDYFETEIFDDELKRYKISVITNGRDTKRYRIRLVENKTKTVGNWYC